jgi:hypothetical protein
MNNNRGQEHRTKYDPKLAVFGSPLRLNLS